jgi:hypothetical protein
MSRILNYSQWVLNESEQDTETTGADITADELKKAVQVVSGLVSRGFTKNQAVALAGNMSVESRQPPNPAFDPKIGRAHV